MPIRNKYTTKVVSANELNVGDLIISHGGLFRVREVIVSQAHEIDERGVTHANICDFLGDAHPDMECSIPVAWRKDWNQQGNSLAKVAVIVAVHQTEVVY